MSRRPILSAAVIAALFALCAAPALAAQAEPQTTTISTADLNLATPQGTAQLRARLRSAVRAVCGEADTRDLQAMADRDRCRALTQEQADFQVRSVVAAAHRSARMATASRQ
jgi:UrcA family protein